MKHIPLTIILLGVAIFLTILLGCTTNKQIEFKPLPPEKLHDLLHVSENYAYKSVTKKDYECKEDC